MQPDLKKKALSYVVWLLGRQSYPTYILRKKLKEKEYEEEHIEHAIGFCLKHGYINDKQWLKRKVESLIAKSNGPRMIVQKLMAKGAPLSDIKAEIEGLEERVLIRQWYEKKYSTCDLSDPKQKKRVYDGLARRGFSSYQIIEFLQLTV